MFCPKIIGRCQEADCAQCSPLVQARDHIDHSHTAVFEFFKPAWVEKHWLYADVKHPDKVSREEEMKVIHYDKLEVRNVLFCNEYNIVVHGSEGEATEELQDRIFVSNTNYDYMVGRCKNERLPSMYSDHVRRADDKNDKVEDYWSDWCITSFFGGNSIME